MLLVNLKNTNITSYHEYAKEKHRDTGLQMLASSDNERNDGETESYANNEVVTCLCQNCTR